MNILVTGSKGQLGSEFQNLSNTFLNHTYYFTDIEDLDITKEEDVLKYLQSANIQVVINCAAYTAVDKAEDEQGLAALVNTTGPEVLAKCCEKVGAAIMHVSTDYVFNGENYKPYEETDKVNPIGVYGDTKYNGEQAVLSNCKKAYVIRTSWLYSIYGNNFVKTMLRLTEERDELGVIFDQVGTPTYAADLALAILQIIEHESFLDNAGIYHFSNEGVISWYDFTKSIARIAGNDCYLKPLESHEYPTKSKRPHYSVLNKSKYKRNFGFVVPYWEESLKTCIELLKDEN